MWGTNYVSQMESKLLKCKFTNLCNVIMTFSVTFFTLPITMSGCGAIYSHTEFMGESAATHGFITLNQFWKGCSFKQKGVFIQVVWVLECCVTLNLCGGLSPEL